MKAFWQQLIIQLRMDLRDKSILLVFYLVPLGFYAVVGSVFSAVNPEIKPVLAATMAIFSITMGAIIGLPPALVKLREAGSLRAYQASGIPSIAVLISLGASAFIHLSIVALIIFASAPSLFGAEMPQNISGYLVTLAALLLCSVAVGLLVGATAKNQPTAMMLSQAIFLPSLMLSGIMFPANLLPSLLQYLGSVLPATHSMRAFRGLAYGLVAEYSAPLALLTVIGIG
ncbi:MAG: ABC transporter permease [Firmicutes bacterium]|nr:ABC transporter permease [Bacillota bacterium]